MVYITVAFLERAGTMVKEILLLGNAQLYEISEPLGKHQMDLIRETVDELHDTLMAYRQCYKAGRAIAAPQIGVKSRLIYMNIDGPMVFINPEISFPDNDKMDVLDDCMSFPGLYVNLKRYKRCVIKYLDMDWNTCEMALEGDLAELIQHEYDHLDGILATMRAEDNKALVMKKM